MRRKNIIPIFFLAVVIAGIFLLSGAATPAKNQKHCKESLDQCCKKKGTDESNKLIWETLPQRFFSSISFD